ncbi:MAG: NADH-quinone oxidoreductase subunit L [Abditibacteriales bacterium]|nr:NADH-quinone oxidoreductase subunit L [Abditibacteriales bacterium]MDW8364580.1 NADH-quinone oxidoreductase subunit L [Abditibacteriales bacterium]
MLDFVWLCIFFPLVGVLVNGFFGARLPKRHVGWIGCGAVALSLAVAIGCFIQLLNLPQRVHEVVLFDWIAVGNFRVPFAFRVDPLSMVMLLVVTGVGFLIHVYSIGYMGHDPHYARFFTYLNLFMAAMLTLVLANNFLLMFVGWEGVGLCSYLLIGFWFERPSAAEAGKKAFIVNRIGDFGFILGMLLIFKYFGTLDFQDVFEAAASKDHIFVLGVPLLTLITLLLFIGATGKSAQIPLYIWLPDAMEGPTPVSALIHAATMVTAGVYMVARCHVLYLYAPVTMSVVAIIGALTAILAATIALAQNDIKRVLAYSTVSQLGYMFLGCGVGAFAAGIFHLYTHAFFKALLFLGAGSVIHALEHAFHQAHEHRDPQDMRHMGGLKKYMPTTYRTFLIGAAALAGAPFLSGFWSKDEILFSAFNTGIVPLSKVLYGIGLLTALLTAFYMTRQCIKVFAGHPRFDEGKIHPHESPGVMTIPLWMLAVGSLLAGFIGTPWFNAWEKFLAPVFESHASEEAMKAYHSAHNLSLLLPLMLVAVVVAAIGWLAGRAVYKQPDQEPLERFAFYKHLVNKWYVDELYNKTIVALGYKLSDWSARFDLGFIDGIVNRVAGAIAVGAQNLRNLQTSYVRNYALVMVLGGVLLVTYLTYFALR